MRRMTFLLACLLSTAVVAQEQPPAEEPQDAPAPAEAAVSDAPPAPPEEGVIYRSVGEDGSIVFSDKPSPGAKKVEIEETQTIEAPPPPSFVYERRQQQESNVYSRLAIVDPANDAQIRENTGNVTVSVAVEPSLLGSDRLVLLMDGREAGTGTQTTFSLENVDRGTHELTAVVLGSDGSARMSSTPVTFHMLRYFEGPAKPGPKPGPKPAPPKPR